MVTSKFRASFQAQQKSLFSSLSLEMAEGALFGSAPGHGQILPVRLTSTLLSNLAREMELPRDGSAADIRVVVEGRLLDMGRDPFNIQVELLDSKINLLDAEGVFFSVVEQDEEFETSDLDSEEENPDVSHELSWYKSELAEITAQNLELTATVDGLQAEVELGKARIQELWKLSCSQLVVFDDALSAKDVEIEKLVSRIDERESGRCVSAPRATTSRRESVPAVVEECVPRVTGGPPPVFIVPPASKPRRGKAPPISVFTGEDVECQLEEWLPSLERASTWNGWSEEDKLIQLAGHLDGRALQEWNLMKVEDKNTFERGVEVLRSRIDPANKTAAAQDFRHTTQRESESVSDFVRRLERMFQVAYGRDHMTSETRDMLLYCQVQESLRYELMKSPAVSGSSKYSELCTAAKNEEKRIADLRKRQQYAKGTQHGVTKPKQTSERMPSSGSGTVHDVDTRKCFYCKKVGHFIYECPNRKSKGTGKNRFSSLKKSPVTKQVKSEPEPQDSLMKELPTDLLYSSSSEEEAMQRQVRVTDEGSCPPFAHVVVNGVPADGIVDTGADITIIGRDLFAKVAAVSRLRKNNFRKTDKVPRTYDRKTFDLDGCIDLDISRSSLLPCM